MLKNIQKFILGLSCAFFLTACQQPKKEPVATVKEENTATTQEAIPGAGNTVTIRSIGDILLHDGVYYNGQQGDGTYNFDFMLEPVAPYLKNADITTANMETIVAGHQLGVSTYPQFNAPEEIVDTLLNVGVDIVSHASNHTVDFGAAGVHASINTLKEKGMPYVGAYESWDDYNHLRILEANGIKVGFLNYTYGTNGLPVPEDEPYLVTLIDTELIPLEIQRLKEYCDVAVVIFQFGDDAMLPVQSQLDLTDLCIKAGANYVLGGHPHIMQPFKRFGDSQVAWYSHGNFLSGQIKPYEKVGGIGEVTFKKQEDGSITVEDVRVMPTYNFGYPEWNSYLVVPLAQAQERGLYNGDEMLNEVKQRFTEYDSSVKVVDYLDDTPSAE
ncbi:CapA family protein [Facklamia hominis]|uniref:CapA family protein n=1 Tax=Facklamia hominis TaxID=178214 RepID=UPI0003535ACF|nr:CapA family protein [Facklamia hominis]EPH12745.1 hypothetical protein HMPREF9260_00333 [Facklamia hominis ACS-120-V-Sch10]